MQEHGGEQTVCSFHQDSENDSKNKSIAELLKIHVGKAEKQGG